MSLPTAEVKLSVDPGVDGDPEEAAALGKRLRQEILQLDVEDVQFVREGVAPAGSKGDPITMGALAVTLAPAAMTSLFNLLQSWMTRHDKSTVTIEMGTDKVVLTGSPSKEQREIIQAALARHQQPS